LFNSTPILLRRGPGDHRHVLAAGAAQMHLLAGLAHEVVRRLAYQERDPARIRQGPPAHQVERLCEALIATGDTADAEEILAEIARGESFETLCLQYLSAATRMLGDWWLEDRASFAQVTTATGKIFEILRKADAPATAAARPTDVTVVFASVPGEQHTLGVRMAADLFRGDGWEIALKLGYTQDELIAEIRKLKRCIVGLSIGGRHSLEALGDVVTALHTHCPEAVIVVSGQDIEELRPHLAAMGLDGIAGELQEAKTTISALWDREMTRPK
jgi:methanogenic corrinoid protein MtbC1